MPASVPAWGDQVKAQIAGRYGRMAATDDFPADGHKRALDSGYPPDWLNALPAPVVARYSGCGWALEGVDLADVGVAVDLGCGAGLDALLLAHALGSGAMVVAVDLAPEMLVRLRESARLGHSAPIHAIAGDIELLPLKDGIADLVLANAAMNLTVDKRSAFAEIARVLRPGGKLVARDLVREGLLPVDLALDPAAWNTSLGGVTSEADLAASLSAAGLAEIRISHHRPFGPATAIRVEAVRPG